MSDYDDDDMMYDSDVAEEDEEPEDDDPEVAVENMYFEAKGLSFKRRFARRRFELMLFAGMRQILRLKVPRRVLPPSKRFSSWTQRKANGSNFDTPDVAI
jgi:hypothetical protein